MNLPLLTQQNVKGQKVFLRLDLNVPMSEKKIIDTSRIEATLPTIKYLLEQQARVVVASHLGRKEQQLSLEPVAGLLGQLLQCEVLFVNELASAAPQHLLKDLKPHQLIVLENLRLDERETQNNLELAQLWASYTDLYVNDAFGTCHRKHTSLVALPQLVEQKAVGFLIEREIKMLNQVLSASTKPFVCVLGGAKVSDKIALIDNLMDRVDEFIIGGAMAYTFLAALKQPVGDSRVDAKGLQFAKHLIKRLQVREKKLLLPVDHVVVSSSHWPNIKPEAAQSVQVIQDEFMGVDVGPQTRHLFSEKIKQAQCVFLNGPMGVFEKSFIEGSREVLQAAVCVQQQGGVSVLGGGDSLAMARQLDCLNQLSFVSTGGGASLDYLSGHSLPALEVFKP